MEETELEVLLSLDGSSFEAAVGYVAEFSVKRTAPSAERPHGISYALVFRPLEHDPEKCEAVFRKDHAQSKT